MIRENYRGLILYCTKLAKYIPKYKWILVCCKLSFKHPAKSRTVKPIPPDSPPSNHQSNQRECLHCLQTSSNHPLHHRNPLEAWSIDYRHRSPIISGSRLSRRVFTVELHITLLQHQSRSINYATNLTCRSKTSIFPHLSSLTASISWTKHTPGPWRLYSPSSP